MVLHELGNSLAARLYKIGTRRITLLPIGGVAELDRMPKTPKHELVVALAGPAVNVGIAGLLGIFLLLSNSAFHLELAATGQLGLIPALFVINISLVLFNLLPAFPMDGGRVLRAILAMRRPYPVATDIAARVGKFIAVAIGLFALFNLQLFLVALAAFVFFAGEMERRRVHAEARQDQLFDGWQLLRPRDPSAPAAPDSRDPMRRIFVRVDPFFGRH
ncbi:MAG: site-2 protease family protein [Verrucomicrobiales bacterium]